MLARTTDGLGLDMDDNSTLLQPPNTHLFISSILMEYSQLPPVPTHYPYLLRSFTDNLAGSDQGTLHIIDGYGMMAIIIPTTHFLDATHP